MNILASETLELLKDPTRVSPNTWREVHQL